jgi:hypothetical protein
MRFKGPNKISLIFVWPDEWCPLLVITENKHPEMEHRSLIQLYQVPVTSWKTSGNRRNGVSYMVYTPGRMGQYHINNKENFYFYGFKASNSFGIALHLRNSDL